MKRILALLLALSLLAALCACGKGEDKASDVLAEPPVQSEPPEESEPPKSESEAQPLESIIVPGSVFNYVSSYHVSTFDQQPQYAGLLVENVAEGLLYLEDNDPEKVRGLIAESWSKSDDGRVWTFAIREGVTFSDGSVCDAFAVEAWWNKLSELVTIGYFNVPINQLESWKAEDAQTFIITLYEPDHLFDIQLASHGRYHVLKADVFDPEQPLSTMVATGPYRIYSVGETIVLKARPDYWFEAKSPQVETVNILSDNYDDKTWLLGALLSGEVDGADNVLSLPHYMYPDFEIMSGSDAAVYLAENGYDGTIDRMPNVDRSLILFNVPSEPLFEQRQVRQAISMLIDRDAINEKLYNGLGFVSDSFWAEGAQRYVSGDFSYDPDRAFELLAEVGLGIEDIAFETEHTRYESDIHAAIAECLNSHGANVTVTELPPYQDAGLGGTAWKIRESNSSSGIYSPTAWLGIFFNEDFRSFVPSFYTHIYDPETYEVMREIYESAAECTTYDEAVSVSVRITEMLQDEAAAIPGVIEPKFNVVSSKFENINYFESDYDGTLLKLYDLRIK